MQIKHATARGMGYGGSARGLLDAETNLKYAVRYLRGAWMVADGDPDLADRLYSARLLLRRQAQGTARRDRAWQGQGAPAPGLELYSALGGGVRKCHAG